MAELSVEDGVLAAMEEDFVKHKVPRILDIKEKLTGGATLDNWDIEFLEEAFNDALRVRPVVNHHPELQAMYGRVVSLYREIMELAQRNEQSGAAKPSGG